MPRVLPWKRRERESAPAHTSTHSSPIPHVKQEEAVRARNELGSVSSSDGAASVKRTMKRPRRSMSTSPPPEPLQENFMVEGVDGDDRYRMVEDEFLTMAREFTAHLHAAEYKRLKAASEIENAQMIKNISRPVVGQMTDLVKIKQERKGLIQKQRLATQKLRRDGNGDENTGTDDPNDDWQKQSLYGLMESPGKQAKHPSTLPLAPSVTRAAAGFNRRLSDVASPNQRKPEPPSDTMHHHEGKSQDRMKIPGSHGLAHRISRSMPTPARGKESNTSDFMDPSPSNSYKVTEDTQNHQSEAAEGRVISDDEDMDFIARLKKRQEERRRSRGQRKPQASTVRSNSDHILPDFL